jgi:hypothetical protein
MSKNSKSKTKYKSIIFYISLILIIILIIIILVCIFKKIFNNIEGLDNNNEFVAYKLSKGREVSKNDFIDGKWPWNNNNNNINNKGNGDNNCNMSGICAEPDPDFIKNITAATNRWIDLVTNENLIGGGISNETRIEMITDLFCLNKLNGNNCSNDSMDDYCGSLFGTVSNKLKNGRDNIKEYFEYFANIPGLSARSESEPIFNIQKLSNDVYLNSTIITWTWDNGPGSNEIDPLITRMSFIYKKRPNEYNDINYCIVQLHSSELPDKNEEILSNLDNMNTNTNINTIM